MTANQPNNLENETGDQPETDAGADAATPSVRDRVIRGSVWTVGGFGGMQILRLGSNIVLTRLLFPEYFGLMALVMMVMEGLEMFSDVGVRTIIIQSKRGDEPAFLNTAWTVQVLRGIVLWLAAVGIAWPLGWFYDQPMLFPLIAVTGTAAVVRGFGSTSLLTLNRELALGALVRLELFAKVVAVTAMIIVALLTKSIWALVAGFVFEHFLKTVASHVILRQNRDRFAWEREALSEIFHFGKWVFPSTILTFLALNVDRMVLGKLLTIEEFGVFSIALLFAKVVGSMSAILNIRVVFPVLSMRQDDPKRMVHTFIRARQVVHAVGVWVCAGMVVGSPLFFRVAYDSRYLEAGRMAQWLAVLAWVTILTVGVSRVPLAMGRSKVLFFTNAFRLLGFPLAIIGYRIHGMEGFILGMSLGLVVANLYPVLQIPCCRLELLLQDLRYTLLFAGASGAGLLGVYLAERLGWPFAADGVVFGVCLLFGILATFEFVRKIRSRGPDQETTSSNDCPATTEELE